jgi:PPOX class probable F420-dependent enzyme
MDQDPAAWAAARIDAMLRSESVVWLSTVSPDGAPHLVPIWFSWDGETVLIASKPHARKVANLRANPSVMLALGEPDDDFDVGMIQGTAELLDAPAGAVRPAAFLAKYRARMAAIGLSADEFLRTYSQVIRIRPTRFLPWHGRTVPPRARAQSGPLGGLRRLLERVFAPPAVRRSAPAVA